VGVYYANTAVQIGFVPLQHENVPLPQAQKIMDRTVLTWDDQIYSWYTIEIRNNFLPDPTWAYLQTGTQSISGALFSFNPALTDSSNVAIVSNTQNLTIKGISPYGNALTTKRIPLGAKVMFSATLVNTNTGLNDGIGVAQPGFNILGPHYLGEDTQSICNYNTTVLYNDETVGTVTTFTTGDVVDVAVDMVNDSIWFRVNGGVWNISGGDPATNAQPIGMRGLSSTTLYPAFEADYTNGSVYTEWTINTTSAYSVPNGFQFWGN
jgi:hypothetical protein